MEEFPRYRGSSASVGSSRRPPKRQRTEISRDDPPAAGPSTSRPAREGPALQAPANVPVNSFAVPGSVILPFRESQGRRTVIDLTDDTPPRRQHEIIDVDALPDRPSSYFDVNPPGPNYEGEYQLLMSRRRFPRSGALHPPPARPVEPNLNQPYNSRPYTAPRYHREPILGHGARAVHDLGGQRNVNGAQNLLQQLLGGVFAPVAQTAFDIEVRAQVQVNDFSPPGLLDYRMGVNGIMGNTPEPDNGYKKPAPAKEGFTRSPTTDDLLVCPSCNHELGTHSDEENQATVWLGKCGHVYCGKCAATYKAIHPRSRKGRVHQANCRVDLCNQKLTGKNLWEIFL